MILFIPGSLTLGAGVIFGVLWGSIMFPSEQPSEPDVSLVGRYLVDGWAQAHRGNNKFKQLIRLLLEKVGKLSDWLDFSGFLNLLNNALESRKFVSKTTFPTWLGFTPGNSFVCLHWFPVGSLASLGLDKFKKKSHVERRNAAIIYYESNGQLDSLATELWEALEVCWRSECTIRHYCKTYWFSSGWQWIPALPIGTSCWNDLVDEVVGMAEQCKASSPFLEAGTLGQSGSQPPENGW